MRLEHNRVMLDDIQDIRDQNQARVLTELYYQQGWMHELLANNTPKIEQSYATALETIDTYDAQVQNLIDEVLVIYDI